MNRNIWLAGGAVAVIAIGVAAWQLTRKPDPVPVAGAPAAMATPAALPDKVAAATPEALAPRKEGDDLVMGLGTASVTLIEYASLTCPHCAHFNEATFPQFKEQYVDRGLVKYIYRDYPLDQIALAGSMLARCTGSADKQFAVIDTLFRQQGQWLSSNDTGQILANMKRIVRLGGVSDAAADTCLKDQSLQNAVLQQSMKGQNDFKVNSTPTLIVNGKAYTGALSFQELDTILRPLVGRS